MFLFVYVMRWTLHKEGKGGQGFLQGFFGRKGNAANGLIRVSISVTQL